MSLLPGWRHAIAWTFDRRTWAKCFTLLPSQNGTPSGAAGTGDAADCAAAEMVSGIVEVNTWAEG